MKWSIVLEDLSSSQEADNSPWPYDNQESARKSASEIALAIELHAANDSISIAADEKAQQEFLEQLHMQGFNRVEMKLKAEWEKEGRKSS